MSHQHCLNCEKPLQGAFCSNCGQKADTHRITLKHFVFHDLLHGVFHFEKGMLFTIKQAMFRPGQAALDYIAGKRKPYYNVFLLVLIILGYTLFMRHYYSNMSPDHLSGKITPQTYNEASKKIDDVLSQKSKLIVFLFVPLAAFNSLILFRRAKLNLLEHAILAGMILLGILVIYGFQITLVLTNLFVRSDNYYDFLYQFTFYLTLIYIAFAYFNAFRPKYTLSGTLIRIITMIALFAFQFIVFLILLVGHYTHWEFGDIMILPFD